MDAPVRDRYRIIAIVGEGAAGRVYLAEDLRLEGRRCALKEVALPAASDAPSAERFAREAALLARLDHPGLPGVSDSFVWDGRYYLVMDYVAGDDLRSVLTDALSRGRRLDEQAVRRWAEDVCDVLDYLHRQEPPIVHRDVKPANIKLSPDGRIRLVDLGLALEADAEAGRTATVVAAGSRPYQPLEQYGDDPVDGRADVYALGATMYHLLAGKAPPSAQERFMAPERLPPLRELRPDVSPALAAAVERAMSLHPDDRPPSAGALRRSLAAPVAAAADWSTAVRANAWLIAVLLALLLAAFALSVWP